MGTERSLRRRQERMGKLLDPVMPGPQVRLTRDEIAERAQVKYEQQNWYRRWMRRRLATYVSRLGSDPILSAFETPQTHLARMLSRHDVMVEEPHVRRAAAKRRIHRKASR